MLALFFSGRRLLMTILVLIVAAGLCGLGIWQWNRHLQRAALNARIDTRIVEPVVTLDGGKLDPEQLDYRPVLLRGSYDPAQEILLRNRSYNGATGYHLITPLRIAGSDTMVLVDRGWIPLTAADPESRKAFAIPSEVIVHGIARASQPYQGGPIDPPLSAERARLDAWFRVDIERIQQQIDRPLLPIFVQIQPTPGAAPALPEPAATQNLGQGAHLGYAVQWFSFALVLIGGYIALVLRQQRG